MKKCSLQQRIDNTDGGHLPEGTPRSSYPQPLRARILLLASVLAASTALAEPLTPAGPLVAMLEQSDAWTPLFDGVSLDGWEGDRDGYMAEDRMLVCTPKGGNLYTSKTYGNFAMAFEFVLTPGANNGLGIRSPRQGNPAYAGMELQILDDDSPRYATLKPWQYHGSVYGVQAALRGHLKPAGEWNTQYVIAVGPFIKVILNGTTIVDVDLREVPPAIGKDHPGIQRQDGHLVFCGHGARIEFKNLRIRDFAEDAAPERTGDAPPAGFVSLFNGQNLDGWKGVFGSPKSRRELTPEKRSSARAAADQKMRQHWSAQDRILQFDGEGDSISTQQDYADFELFVDWKIPAAADSGIYLRGSPQVQIWDPANQAQWKHGAQEGSGALWNNQIAGFRPLVRADHPIGAWNTFFIRMVGERVTIELNGLRILDRVIMENYWERDRSIYPAGPIELQNHGAPLSFRNLFIRTL